MKGLRTIDWTGAKTPAYIFVMVLLTLVVVMLPYVIFNDYVTQVFYNIAVSNGGDVDLFNMIVAYWQYYFIFGFVISLMMWAITNSMRSDEM
jgi:multisubunit Na+/H+ antiporter MnhB subunit